MGRIVEKVKIKGDINDKGVDVYVIFDTGSERSYIKSTLLLDNIKSSKIFPFTSKFGGKEHEILERCSLIGEIGKLSFDFSAHPVNDIGVVDGKEIGILIGTTTMEEWDIIIQPKGKKLDLTGLEKREFVEL